MYKTQKVDVLVNVYGKPWQTLVALKSLMLHSGKWIDKIYMTVEKHHPYDDEVRWIIEGFNNVIDFTPKEYYFTNATGGDMDNPEVRHVYRYQYGIENSDKKYVFLMHNDILFTGDIIGNMLGKIGSSAGIGLIGQCWNCSGFKSGMCDGDRHDKVNYSYDEVVDMMQKFPPTRYHFYQYVNKEKPMPLPECRLNEFACIIDREATMKECMPNGSIPLFGAYDWLDCGVIWFRKMIDAGYKFVNYDINKDSDHGYFSKIESRNYNGDKSFFVSGYPTQLHEDSYWKAEELAMEYYQENLWKE